MIDIIYAHARKHCPQVVRPRKPVDTAVPDPTELDNKDEHQFLLQDYHPDNGATMIRPGSHLCLSKPHPDDNKGSYLFQPKNDLVI